MIAPGPRAPEPRGGRAWIRTPLVLALALASTGCGGLFGSFDTAPNGLSRYDDGLRSLLVSGRFDSALALSGPDRSRAGDELLRLQNEGLLAHYAGEYDRSNAALQRSADLAEDRYTRSISRALLSAISSDRVLDYRPPDVERVLFNYYGILNYLEAGDVTGAAVEARRLGYLLDRLEEEGRRGAWRELQATLRRLTGAVFELAGEENDAAVAYRIAASLADPEPPGPGATGDTAVRDPSASVPAGSVPVAPDDSGPTAEVVVLVERGFIAHRVERSANLVLWPEEIEAMRPADGADAEVGEDEVPRAEPSSSGSGRRGEDDAYRASLGVAERVLAGERRAVPARSRAARSGVRPEGTPHLLRVAWPVLSGAATPGDPPVLVARSTGGSEAEDMRAVAAAQTGPAGTERVAGRALLRTTGISGGADLSGALRQEFRADLTRIVATSILRAVAKYSLAETLEKEVSEKDETAGELLGLVANLGGALLERADTRSWNLLPARITLERLRLPAGRTYEIGLESADRSGPAGRDGAIGRPGPTGRMPTRTVTLRPGELRILSVRAWPEGRRP